MKRTFTARQQAARRQRLGCLTAAGTLLTALLLSFAPALVTFGTGVSSAIVWCQWLDAHEEDADG